MFIRDSPFAARVRRAARRRIEPPYRAAASSRAAFAQRARASAGAERKRRGSAPDSYTHVPVPTRYAL
ncbi:hypothetical protein, partial [Burkholderia pseudomallei]|uniref:hypothetical protein n=1 Tax=Burkholderia pseudomallei TaxID=28450 RepID=UPI001CA5D69C